MPDASLRDSKVVHNVRRSSVFNKLFMKHITDLMSTGEVAPNLLGETLQISRVQVVHGFRNVNIYWFSNNDKEDEAVIEKMLLKTATQLRHKLCQLNVLGNVPKLNFVRDKQYSMLAEIDKKLAIADFGEDDEFSESELESEQKQLPETCSETSELNTVDESKDDVNEAFIPQMKNDILGLNHYSIMSKIKASMQKSSSAAKSRHLNVLPTQPTLSKLNPFEVPEYLTVKEEKEAFTNFLHKRKIEEKKRRKCENKQQEYDCVYETNENNYNEDLDDRFNSYDDFETYKI